MRMELPAGPLVVALSGGADSAALAYLVGSARAVHVNHGLAASSVMESAARGVADEVGVPLEVVAASVEGGPSPEAMARDARYRALADATDDDESVLTAHTLDDDAETVLINLVRGTGWRGLAGIPAFREPNVHRPILSVSRSETRELAALAGLPFIDDPMNDDPGLLRNRVRRLILPALEELNPRVTESIARAARHLREEAGVADSLTGFLPIDDEGLGASVPRGVLLSLDRRLANRLLIRLLSHIGEPTETRVQRLWDVVTGESHSAELGGGVVARIEGPMLVVSADGPGALS